MDLSAKLTAQSRRLRIHKPGNEMPDRDKPLPQVSLFLVARLLILAGLPLEGLRGYGDLAYYFRQAELGWPYIDYWVEYPPVFPFLSTLIHRFVNGSEHAHMYLLAGLFSLAQAGSLALFLRLAKHLYGEKAAQRLGWVYFALLAGLPYGWWYFDALAVFCMLLALTWLVEGRGKRAGLAAGLGMLAKWFPGLVLVAAWQLGGVRRTVRPVLVALGLAGMVMLGLYSLAPENTRASLLSQGSKGSWETVWALLDGNFQTGNFGPQADLREQSTALLPSRNPARLSPWLTLPVFFGTGLWLSHRTRTRGETEAIAFTGLAWCVFLLWTPGYSPQWVTYLLPLILLALPERPGVLAGLALVLVNLLEWPVLLSRGLFWSLWITIPLRFALHLLVAGMFWRQAQAGSMPATAARGIEDGAQPAVG
jgi:hypothetical protein